jgi:hypothetical protein
MGEYTPVRVTKKISPLACNLGERNQEKIVCDTGMISVNIVTRTRIFTLASFCIKSAHILGVYIRAQSLSGRQVPTVKLYPKIRLS